MKKILALLAISFTHFASAGTCLVQVTVKNGERTLPAVEVQQVNSYGDCAAFASQRFNVYVSANEVVQSYKATFDGNVVFQYPDVNSGCSMPSSMPNPYPPNRCAIKAILSNSSGQSTSFEPVKVNSAEECLKHGLSRYSVYSAYNDKVVVYEILFNGQVIYYKE